MHAATIPPADAVIERAASADRMAPPENLANWRDSRGGARALTGDYAGAIEDFQAFVDWTKGSAQYDTMRTQREGWIATLKTGKSPFDKATLDSLLAESAPY